MSIQLIQQYYSKVEQIIRYSGVRNESSLRKPFQDLLEQYARSKKLVLVAEVGVPGRKGKTVYPDGTLKDACARIGVAGKAKTKKTTWKRDHG